MKSKGFESEIPNECPKCGRKLRLVIGDFGKFLGCTGYPQCDYSHTIDNQINCPVCGKEMQTREGKYGKFMGCTGFPDCKFTLNIIESRKKEPMKKLKMENEDSFLSLEKILNILEDDWYSLNDIAAKLNIDDKMDIKFLQMQLKKLEKNKQVEIKTIQKQKFWKKK